MQPARLLRINLPGTDRYEAIVTKCREMKVAGATVFRGVEGYGDGIDLRHPILITIVDTAENIDRLIPVLEQMIDTGTMSVSDVKIRRVQE